MECSVFDNMEFHRPPYSDLICILIHRNQIFTKIHLFETIKRLNLHKLLNDFQDSFQNSLRHDNHMVVILTGHTYVSFPIRNAK